MIALRCLAALATLGGSPFPVQLGAQHSTPVALSATDQSRSTVTETSLVSRKTAGIAFADTTETKRPSVKPFLLGGAILGGMIGGALASSYNPCGESQPGVYCTSTDVATGVVIGAGVGIVAGWFAWAVTNSTRK
jgi:hypothetical protein